MKKKQGPNADTSISAGVDRELLDQWRDRAREVLDFMSGFEAPKFSSDSLELKRPDHALRVASLEAAVERVRTRCNEIIEGGIDSKVSSRFVEEVSEFLRASDDIFCPETRAWKELWKTLREALKDPRIEFNPEVVRFTSSMLALVERASGHWDYESVLQPLERKFMSLQASRMAAKKNLEPREWVKNEWAARSDTGQSKASFARQYAPLVKKRFDVDVTPEQISRVWLPKG